MPYLFAHGSTATPENMEDLKLQLFNYTDGAKKTEKAINNGLDSHGPGIYAFFHEVNEATPFPEELRRNAEGYACNPKGDGTLVVFSLDNEFYPANRMPVDAVPEEEWQDVVTSMISKLRALEGVNHDTALELHSELSSKWHDGEEPTKEEIETLSKVSGIDLSEFEYIETPDDLDAEFEGLMETYDPASRIMEEGGPPGVVDYAMAKSDNLWDVLKNIYFMVATENTGASIISHNRRFQESVKECLTDPQKVALSLVDDERFAVVFDTDAIVPEVMITNQMKVDEGKVDKFIDAVQWLHENHSELSEKHLKRVISDHGLEMGVDLSDENLSLLAARSSPREMNAYDIKSIRENFGEREVREYSSGTPFAKMFMAKEIDPKIETPAYAGNTMSHRRA